MTPVRGSSRVPPGVAVLGTAALVVVLSTARSAVAAPCPPTAALGGDAEAIARVASALQQLGVVTRTEQVALEDGARTGPAHCPVVVAAVELDPGGGIAVAIREGGHRSEGRVVSDATLAAAWIDSWLRDDFEAPPVPAMAAAAGATAPRPAPVDLATESASAAAPTVFDRFAVAASYEQAWTDDGTGWSGVIASACVRVHGLCLGGRVGYASQQVTSGATAAARRDEIALATASWSHDVGRMSVAPELGLGLGRFTTERLDGCAPPPPTCDPSDPACAQPPPCPYPAGNTAVYVGDGFDKATIAPRIAATVRVAVPLFEHVWLDGLAGVTATPFAHASAYPADPSNPLPPVPPQELALPGEPTMAFQLGVGLRVGAR